MLRIRSRTVRFGMTAAALATFVSGAPAAQPSTSLSFDVGPDSTACPYAGAMHEKMDAQMPADPQMRLTPLRKGTQADSARARQFVAEMGRVLAKYEDPRVAEADGFRMWLSNLNLPVYHFTSWRRAIESLVRFDPARPTSLLYAREPDGRFRLLGAMYPARASASDDDLDALIPLSLGRWHEHVNWCVPPPKAGHPWEGEPAPGIVTRAGCDSIGGHFRPRVHDWSIHVYALAGDDPRAIWCVDTDHDAMREP
jgi:hypothetical protein